MKIFDIITKFYPFFFWCFPFWFRWDRISWQVWLIRRSSSISLSLAEIFLLFFSLHIEEHLKDSLPLLAFFSRTSSTPILGRSQARPGYLEYYSLAIGAKGFFSQPDALPDTNHYLLLALATHGAKHDRPFFSGDFLLKLNFATKVCNATKCTRQMNHDSNHESSKINKLNTT